MERVLQANGAFSASSGAALLAGATLLDGATGLEAWFLMSTGVLLIGYGLTLWRLAATGTPSGWWVAIVLDLGWVLAAGIVLIGFPSAMTSAGRLGLLAVSVVVVAFAGLQIRELWAGGAPPDDGLDHRGAQTPAGSP